MKHTCFAIALWAVVSVAAVAYGQSVSTSKIRNRKVKYAAPRRIKIFPLPVIGWKRPGLATEPQRAEVLNKIVYPVVNGSEVAVAAVVVEFDPDDKQSFIVDVLWHNGEYGSALIKRNSAGQIEKDAYKIFLERPGT